MSQNYISNTLWEININVTSNKLNTALINKILKNKLKQQYLSSYFTSFLLLFDFKIKTESCSYF